jgi:AcrR family transcriptional regulator
MDVPQAGVQGSRGRDAVRVTSETKEATRQSILAAARKLFASDGFEATTTRDISREANIAAGTLFNYFASKEAIVGCLAQDALAKAHEEFHGTGEEHASLQEALFAYVATGLRKLRPLRKSIAPAIDAVFSPAAVLRYGESIRTQHLEAVGRLVAEHGLGGVLTAHALQLYWTLYTGVVAFWARDRSPKQEDTLALLDESIEMFVLWLTR